MARASSNGIELEYDVRGSGEPLLLIMGLGAQLVMWPDEFCDQLAAAGFQVIRFDNRDIGLSTKTQGPLPSKGAVMRAMLLRRTKHADYQMSDMAADAAGLLDHLGIDRAHVVGASMGGMIAQQLTIDHPQRVKSLCSIMSTVGDLTHGLTKLSLIFKARKLLFADPSPDPKVRLEGGVQLNRLISGPHFDEANTRATLEIEASRSDDTIGTTRQTMAIMASPDRRPGLRTVTAPTLVIHGLLDPLVRPSGGTETARCVAGSRLVMFNDMAHDLPRVRWTEVVEAIRENAERAA